VPVAWIRELFTRHKARLFSANVRNYLGSRRSDSNINHGIKSTAESEPDNFWVYNNGITAVVNRLEPPKGGGRLHIEGISIVNGAQTTGAIGSLEGVPSPTAMVAIRFVRCDDPDTLSSIIRYNNSQNRIEASDFRSNDSIQKRLRTEFETIPGVKYLGGRRGGADDIIRRPPDLIPSNVAAQALMAFHQNPVAAYNEKSELWESDSYYSKIFNDRTTARHALLCYSLLKAIEAKKLALTEKEKAGDLTDSASKQLTFLRSRGAVFLLVSAVASAMESFSDRKIPDLFSVSFGPAVSQTEAKNNWAPIIDCVLPLNAQLTPSLGGGLKNLDTVREDTTRFVALVEATKAANAQIYRDFAARLSFA
jgi:hypothetical protein